MKTSLEKLYYFSVLMGIDQSLGIKGFSCLRIDVFIRIYPEFCANLTKTCTNKFFICFPRYLIRGVFFLSSTYYFRGFCSSKCVDQKCTIFLFKCNKDTRTTSVVLLSLLLTSNRFHTFVVLPIAHFNQVNNG